MTSNRMPADPDLPLKYFELPKAWVRPSVELCRFTNTLVDAVFYDVEGLMADLRAKDLHVQTTMPGEKLPSRIIDLNALTNPEGVLLLIDTTTAPFVHRFDNVREFLDSPHKETDEVKTVTLTGVGSSALGSAAFGWSVSKALEAPVLAIVPGYGLADIALQAMGGWFGFGLHDWLHLKSTVQNGLASVAPSDASIGRNLSSSTPGAKSVRGGGPVFRYGSGSSDVLHALIQERASPFRHLIGHSKGALQIGNALCGLDPDKLKTLCVTTLGCPIAKLNGTRKYRQFLGLFDALGQMNMWGHWPDQWVLAWHTTNPFLPLAMDTTAICREAARDYLVSADIKE